MLKLYYAPNTISLASIIALEEAGADYALHRVDFAKSEQRGQPYLAVNPKARVPALETERGILTETPAILLYLAQRFPAARLAPLDDPFALARLQAFNSYLCATLHIAHSHRMRGSRWADDEAAFESMRRKVPQSVGECFALIEKAHFAGPWVLGADYSLADGYLFTLAQWMEADGVDPAKLPVIAEHHRRMRERPAVERALAAERGERKPARV
jgi:glutathione S-transferase